MKTLAGPQTGWGDARSSLVEPAESRDQLGGGGDHARLVGGSHDLVDRRSLAANGDLPGRRAPAGDRQHVAERLGEQHGVSPVAVADELIELAAVAPGGFVQVVRRQQDRAGRQRLGIAECPDRLDRGGDPCFHVRCAAAGDPAVLDLRRDERQVHRVEMAVELKGRPRPAAIESNRDRRRGRVAPIEPLDAEPVGLEDLRETVADRPGIAGGAGHFDQPSRRLDQPMAVHVGLQRVR